MVTDVPGEGLVGIEGNPGGGGTVRVEEFSTGFGWKPFDFLGSNEWMPTDVGSFWELFSIGIVCSRVWFIDKDCISTGNELIFWRFVNTAKRLLSINRISSNSFFSYLPDIFLYKFV